MNTTLTCRSAAKVNLTLDILSRRSDGYHELQSVVHTIGLWDTLTFEFNQEPGVALRCNDPQLETDSNLCLKAARAWREAVRARGPEPFNGLRITLEKHIPHGAGLGGGSSNAAATLVALNRCAGNALEESELHHLATRLGADVPLFLRGGCALMEGIGDKITPLPSLEGWLVLLKPPAGLSTPAVYRSWDELEQPSGRGTPALCATLKTGDLTQVANALHNDLSLAARQLGTVDIEAMCRRLKGQGALGALMTGSGSAVFGLFESEAQARQAAGLLDRQRIAAAPCRVLVAPFVHRGIEFIDPNVVSVQ